MNKVRGDSKLNDSPIFLKQNAEKCLKGMLNQT